MGAAMRQRTEFVDSFNQAFSAGTIEATLARLGPHVASMDALEIVHRAELVSWMPHDAFFKYRDTVGIPTMNVQIVTVALHSALLAPKRPRAVVLSIVEGPAESVAVTHMPDHVAITLTRATAQPVRGGGD